MEKGNKKFLLPWLIKNLKPEVVNALVFSRTKHGADKIAKDLNKQGIPAAAIHGNKSQTARVTALEDFKAGKTRVLVATDIAARGIDISELSHVFNYDLPEVPETYVHRIGRTARAGADGTAVSFCAPEEKEYLAGIEKLNRRQIPVVSGHPWDGVPAPVKAAPPVRGKKPKAEAEQPEKPVKAEKPAKAEKGSQGRKARCPQEGKKRLQNSPAPRIPNRKKEHPWRKTRSALPAAAVRTAAPITAAPAARAMPSSRPTAAATPSPNSTPHFVSAPEATPLRPVKKAPAAQPAAKQTAPAQNGQRQRGGQPARAEQRTDRNDPRTEQRAERNSRNARPAQNSQNQQGSRNNRNEVQSSRPARPAKSEAPRGRSRNTAPARDEDPGLMLISRRPPQQKFTNFEEYMTAHGGATAPIEDHTDET